MGKDMEMLNDDDLSMISGGAGIVGNRNANRAMIKATNMAVGKEISFKTRFICPKCGKVIDLEFYTDNTQNYEKCPKCGKPIAVG